MTPRGGRVAFALASACAVAAGAAGLALSGAALSTWVSNPLAWLAGALLGLAVPKVFKRPHAVGVVAAGTAAIAASFWAAPVDGVHRWLDIGPLRVNAAALVLPATLASLALVESRVWSLAAVAAIGLLLVAQPDASQATAFLAASALLLLRRRHSTGYRLLAVTVCAALAIASWFRPDPLVPVPEVESIFALIAGTSVVLAVIAAASLAASSLTPLVSGGLGRRDAASALAAYFALTALAPLAGAYPVPLVGLGMSFPIGWWLGVAVAQASSRSRP